jgi:DNA-binding NtrC family response regulator
MNQSLSTPSTTQNSVLLPSEHTILVIDDDDSVRSVTSDILRRLKHDVLTAHDGLEGIRVYTEHQNLVDIVLLDLSMPQMGGVECYEKLVEVNDNVRVIIMSGYTEEDTSTRFSGDRTIEYLQKPFSTKGLLQKLESLSAR